MDERFNLEKQWAKFLQMAGLSEDRMHPIQKRETKRAFYGAIGQMLVMLNKDFRELSDEDAAKVLMDWENQVFSFWMKESKQVN